WSRWWSGVEVVAVDDGVLMVVMVRRWSEDAGEWRRVVASDIWDRIDQKVGNIFGFAGNTRRKSFPAAAGGGGGGGWREGWPAKRVRKSGKGVKKDSACDFERVTVCDCDKRGDRARIAYLKDEIEALRYVGVEEQKRKWSEVYCGLGDVVAKEYDCLVGFKDGCDGDGNYVSFDPRTQFGDKKGASSGNEPDQMDHVSGVNDGDLDVEEDYYEDEYSDSEYVSIQRPAFYVTGEPDFDSGPPQDGLEYLRRVRWETEHIPKVKVAKVEKNLLNKEQTVYMPSIPDIAACPEHLMPSKEWEDVFLADFSKLRLALSENEESASTISGRIEPIPLAHNIIQNVLQENLDSYQTDDGTVLMQENLDFIPTDDKTATLYDLPTLQTILDMEPVARVTMLRKRITSMETLSSLGRTDCAWLFALCAAIDSPLDADTSASLRCLLRKCAALRAEKMCLDDEVIMLNILATISGKYFDLEKYDVFAPVTTDDGNRVAAIDVDGGCGIPNEGKEINKKCKFIHAINRVLAMHEGPIHEFTLSIETDDSGIEIEHIISQLVQKNTVKKLALNFLFGGYQLPPSSLFLLHQLTDLCLVGFYFDHLPLTFDGFGRLTSLSLQEVYFSNKTLLHLLSNCPLLKTLDINNYLIHSSGDCTIINLFECLPVVENLSILLAIVELPEVGET
nr:hypothetical protein [Tanacetum cinerariifolium]